MDRLTSMAVFVKAVELGSFASVAESTGLSATMVGKHIQHLEDRLGTRILNRTTRRQSLTEFGRIFYERCQIVLSEVEAAHELAVDQQVAPRGTLRVTMPALLGRICVVPLLLEIAALYPDLKLELYMEDRIVDLIGGAYDLSVRTGKVGDNASLMMRRLGSHRMLVCASPGYLESKGTPQTVDDLHNHRTVAYAQPGWKPTWLFRDDREGTIEISPPHKVRLGDLAAVADAAADDAGLVWIPSWLARSYLDAGTLIEAPLNLRCYTVDNYAIWPRSKLMPKKLRVTLDHLASALPSRLDGQLNSPVDR